MNFFSIILCFATLVTFVYAREKVRAVDHNDGIFGIESNNTNCLLVTFKHITITITPMNQTKDDKIRYSYFNETYSNHSEIHSNHSGINILEDLSSCGKTQQSLTFNVSGDELTFNFRPDRKAYNLSSIIYKINNAYNLENHTKIESGLNSTMDSPDLKSVHINIGKTFFCKHRYEFRANLTDFAKVHLSIGGFKFSAFRNHTNSTEFDKTIIECQDPNRAKPGSDIIPIAVGGVLTGFLVLSLVAYLVIRSRKN